MTLRALEALHGLTGTRLEPLRNPLRTAYEPLFRTKTQTYFMNWWWTDMGLPFLSYIGAWYGICLVEKQI